MPKTPGQGQFDDSAVPDFEDLSSGKMSRHDINEAFDRAESNLAEVIKARKQRAVHESPPAPEPFVVPPDVESALAERADEYDRRWEIEDSKDPSGSAGKTLEQEGLRIGPITAEEADAIELAKIAESQETARQQAAHAGRLHQPKKTPTKRLKYPPKPGVTGDKNTPKHIAEIDGERIIK